MLFPSRTRLHAKSKTGFQPLSGKCWAFSLFLVPSAPITLVLSQSWQMSLASPYPRTPLGLSAQTISARHLRSQRKGNCFPPFPCGRPGSQRLPRLSSPLPSTCVQQAPCPFPSHPSQGTLPPISFLNGASLALYPVRVQLPHDFMPGEPLACREVLLL